MRFLMHLKQAYKLSHCQKKVFYYATVTIGGEDCIQKRSYASKTPDNEINDEDRIQECLAIMSLLRDNSRQVNPISESFETLKNDIKNNEKALADGPHVTSKKKKFVIRRGIIPINLQSDSKEISSDHVSGHFKTLHDSLLNSSTKNTIISPFNNDLIINTDKVITNKDSLQHSKDFDYLTSMAIELCTVALKNAKREENKNCFIQCTVGSNPPLRLITTTTTGSGMNAKKMDLKSNDLANQLIKQLRDLSVTDRLTINSILLGRAMHIKSFSINDDGFKLLDPALLKMAIKQAEKLKREELKSKLPTSYVECNKKKVPHDRRVLRCKKLCAGPSKKKKDSGCGLSSSMGMKYGSLGTSLEKPCLKSKLSCAKTKPNKTTCSTNAMTAINISSSITTKETSSCGENPSTTESSFSCSKPKTEKPSKCGSKSDKKKETSPCGKKPSKSESKLTCSKPKTEKTPKCASKSDKKKETSPCGKKPSKSESKLTCSKPKTEKTPKCGSKSDKKKETSPCGKKPSKTESSLSCSKPKTEKTPKCGSKSDKKKETSPCGKKPSKTESSLSCSKPKTEKTPKCSSKSDKKKETSSCGKKPSKTESSLSCSKPKTEKTPKCGSKSDKKKETSPCGKKPSKSESSLSCSKPKTEKTPKCGSKSDKKKETSSCGKKPSKSESTRKCPTPRSEKSPLCRSKSDKKKETSLCGKKPSKTESSLSCSKPKTEKTPKCGSKSDKKKETSPCGKKPSKTESSLSCSKPKTEKTPKCGSKSDKKKETNPCGKKPSKTSSTTSCSKPKSDKKKETSSCGKKPSKSESKLSCSKPKTEKTPKCGSKSDKKRDSSPCGKKPSKTSSTTSCSKPKSDKKKEASSCGKKPSKSESSLSCSKPKTEKTPKCGSKSDKKKETNPCGKKPSKTSSTTSCSKPKSDKKKETSSCGKKPSKTSSTTSCSKVKSEKSSKCSSKSDKKKETSSCGKKPSKTSSTTSCSKPKSDKKKETSSCGKKPSKTSSTTSCSKVKSEKSSKCSSKSDKKKETSSCGKKPSKTESKCGSKPKKSSSTPSCSSKKDKSASGSSSDLTRRACKGSSQGSSKNKCKSTSSDSGSKACERAGISATGVCDSKTKNPCDMSKKKEKSTSKCNRPPRGDTRPRCVKPASKASSSKSPSPSKCGSSKSVTKSPSKSSCKSASKSTTKPSKKPSTSSVSSSSSKCGSSKPASKASTKPSTKPSNKPSSKSSGTSIKSSKDSRKPNPPTKPPKRKYHTLSMFSIPKLLFSRNFSDDCCDENAKKYNPHEDIVRYRKENCAGQLLSQPKRMFKKKKRPKKKECYPSGGGFCPDTACYRVYIQSKKGRRKVSQKRLDAEQTKRYEAIVKMFSLKRRDYSTMPTLQNVTEEAIIQKPHSVSYRQFVLPEMTDNDALICVDSVALSNTDIYMFETGGRHTPDLTLGNEASGVVTKVGRAVSHIQPGDNVALEGGIPCLACDLCKMGRYNICTNLTFRGFLKNQCVHPASFCHKICPTVPLDLAALVPQLALGCNACHLAEVKTNSNVAIIGSCATTICAGICAISMGSGNISIICGMPETKQLIEKFLTQKIQIYDYSTTEKALEEYILSTLGTHPDIVINCSANSMTMNASISALRPAGMCIVAGFMSEYASYNIMDALKKEVRIIPSFRSNNMFPEAIHLLETDRAPLHCLIANCRTCKWNELQSAFKLALSEGNNGPRKAIVKCQLSGSLRMKMTQ